ncbi:ATP-binding protein [Streptomyces europaeiscabiei]|nr:ATP-binding protein [Streptomyces europaeiscabiei]MDX2764485.1 ATP-binding protein [Streptomyces europaeiscabiei]
MRRPGPAPLGTPDQGGRLSAREIDPAVRLRRQSGYRPAAIHTLAKCDWVKKGLPLCLIGDSGTGKSHLLIALGTEAAMHEYRVKYVLATKLVNELVEAADEKLPAKTIARYGPYRLAATRARAEQKAAAVAAG